MGTGREIASNGSHSNDRSEFSMYASNEPEETAVNPLAAYSQQLAGKELHIHRVSEDGVAWADGEEPTMMDKLCRRINGGREVDGVELDGVGADGVDEQIGLDAGKGTIDASNEATMAQQVDLVNGRHSLSHTDSRPSFSSSSNETSSAPTFSTTTTALSYPKESTANTSATETPEDSSRMSRAHLAGSVQPSSYPASCQPFGPFDIAPFFPSHAEGIPMHTVIPPTPPSASAYPPSPPHTPVASSVHSLSSDDNARLSSDLPASSSAPFLAVSITSSSHGRSVSYQSLAASSSSLQPGPSGSPTRNSQGFPVRRSSLLPPSPPSSLSSSLPNSETATSGLRKRGSAASGPKGTRSFRNALGNSTSSTSAHPLQQEIYYDESLSLSLAPSAQQKPNAEDLEDSIARQAEQIRRERQSKRIENERAHAKATKTLKPDIGGEGMSLPRAGEKDKGKGKERERLSDWEKDRDGEPQASPTSVRSQLWAQTSVAGEKAGVRADISAASGITLPVAAGPRRSLSGNASAAAGGVGLISAATARELQPGADGSTVLVGNLIGEDHVNYVMMYNMLTGIRIGVSVAEHPSVGRPER